MIKKLTALLLTFLFIIPVPKTFAASFFEDNELADYSENIRFLSTFGVIDLDNFEDQTKTITRGEFASILISLHGLGDITHSTAGGAVFQDVPTTHEYAAQIKTAVQSGFMLGYSSDSFSPDENLLSEHAIVALVRCLGYGAVIDGSMQQYLAKADEISLTKKVDVSIGFPITRYTLVQLLLNAIDIDFMEGFKREFGITYKVVEDKNILSEVFCVERRRGIVTADKYTGLRTASGTGTSNVLEIDGESFSMPETDRSWVGFNVDYYVDKNSQDEIRYIKQNNKNTVKVLNTEECDITYNDGVYSYFDNDTGKKRTLKLDSGFAVIYNGVAPESSANLTMAPERGSVTLLDNGAGDGWNVVLIENLTYCVAELVDAKDMHIYAKRGTEINLEKAEFFEISDLSGRKMNITDISAGNVILASISQDGKVAKLDVSKQTISGEVKKISESDKEVYIDDKMYRIAPCLEIDEFRIGMKATFMLDKDGYIATFYSNNINSQVGYLVGGYMSDSGEEICFKIFDFSLGNYRTLSNKKKMKVDGNSMSPSEVYSYYTNLPKDEEGKVNAFPVLFDENEKRGITKLVTPFGENQGEDTLNLITKNSNSPYSQPQRGFYTSGVFPTDSSIIYAIPDAPRNAEATEYRKLSTNSFTHDKNYKMEAYRVGDDSDSLYTDILLVGNTSGDFMKALPGVVTDIVREWLPDLDEVVTKVTVGIAGGVTDVIIFDEDSPLGVGIVPALSDGSPRKIATGDVIQFSSTEYKGIQKATDVSMLFSYEEYLQTGDGQLFGSNNIGASTPERRFIDGTVYKKDGNLIMVTNAEITGNELQEQIPLETINTSGGNVYKLETEGRHPEVINASPNDIVSYSVGGANCSRIFYYAEWGWQQIFYIYE